LSLHAKQYDHAVEWIARAIGLDPKPEYLASLGTTLHQQGRREEALKAFDKAVQLKPDDAELWQCMGSILLELARFDHALLSLQQALKLNPRHRDAAYKSGILLNHFRRFEQALAHFDLCEEVLPNHAPTLVGRVRALYYLNRFEDALADGRRVHALDPGNADNCNATGAALRSLGRHEEALQWLDKALEVRPNLVEALENKIIALAELHPLRRGFRPLRSHESAQVEQHADRWECVRLSQVDRQFRGRLGRTRSAVEVAFGDLSEISSTDMARRGKHRRQDHPDLRGRGARRYNSLRPLCADAD